ncbi:MAG: hypothetical protein OEX12_14170 [Gammaproteobacteria bacterium]|nr:hypothetical protein [Gammaproteobacteria bacterium]
MAKPNYAYAKRQRDIAKKQKKEEKRKLKAEAQPADETQLEDAVATADGTQQEDQDLSQPVVDESTDSDVENP